MKITKKLSFGVTVLICLISGFYIQNQIGTRNKVNDFFAGLSGKANNLIEVNYPKDLVIDVNKGQVSLNQKLPYCLLLDKQENMGLIFDGSDSLNVKAFEETPKNFPCKPVAIIGKSFVGGKKENGEIRGWQIPAEMTVKIDQKMLIDAKNKYLPVVEEKGKKLYELLPFLLVLVIVPLVLLTNFWYSWILGIVLKLAHMDTQAEAKNKYWISLVIGAILDMINILTGLIYHWKIDFPFSRTVLITIASIAYLKWRETQVDMTGDPEMAVTEVKPRKAVKKVVSHK